MAGQFHTLTMFYSFLIALSYNIIYQRKHNLYQVDGAEQTELAKCLAACATKHTQAGVANIANGNANAVSDTTAALNKCNKVDIFINFHHRVHIYSFQSQILITYTLQDCANGAAGGAAITSFTFLLSLAIGLFAM